MAVKVLLLIYSVSCFITSSVCLWGDSNNIARQNGINTNCKLLSDCPEFLWLLRNKHDVPGMGFQEVLQYLQSKHCGFDGDDPKVNCPQVDDSIIEEDPVAIVPQSIAQTARASGVIAVNSGGRVRQCSGSITIIHYKRSGSPLEDMKALRLRGRKYGNLSSRVLTNDREVIRIQSEGNCCWRIYSSVRFRGQRQHIHSGFDGKPNINIKSVARTSC